MTARKLHGGKLADPEWRRRRAQLAGAAARRAHHARARARASAYATKARAWSAGYRAGYGAAMRWWKRNVQLGRVDASGRRSRSAVAA